MIDEKKALINLGEVLEKLELKSDVVLVKPNWVAAYKGGYTDIWMVDLLLRALEKKKVYFVESFSFWRTDKKLESGEDYFSSREASFESGKIHQEFFRNMDQWFLKYTGIKEVLERYEAEYICTTDELWQGKGVDEEVIKTRVEAKFSPVMEKELYKRVPSRLWENAGADFLSLAKMKIDTLYGASLSIKNMFGLIPDPNRYNKFHGEDDSRLVQNIVDVNKIYASLFEMKYMNERIFGYCEMDWDEEKSKPMEGDGVVVGAKNGFEADRQALEIMGGKFEAGIEGLLEKYKEAFGEKGV